MKMMHIIETAYRATSEEQDDPAIWMVRAMKGAGADEMTVVLEGNAVNYSVDAQEQPPLVFGAWKQAHAVRISNEITAMVNSGIKVFVVQEDLQARGVHLDTVVCGVEAVQRSSLVKMVEAHDHVARW